MKSSEILRKARGLQAQGFCSRTLKRQEPAAYCPVGALAAAVGAEDARYTIVDSLPAAEYLVLTIPLEVVYRRWSKTSWDTREISEKIYGYADLGQQQDSEELPRILAWFDRAIALAEECGQ